MDEKDFIEKRQANWQKLNAILQKADGTQGLRALDSNELRELAPLYRRAASDLAYARANAISDTLVTHLNGLVGRAYSLFYQTDRKQWGGFLRFFTHDFPDAFRRRLGFFLASLAFLCAGALVGYVVVAQAENNIYVIMPGGSQLHDSIQYWKSGKVTHKVDDGSAAIYASNLMVNNIRVSFVAFALGILGGVMTGVVLFYNGAVVGGMAALMTRVHQHHNFWPGILPHGVVELSETVIAGAAGLSLGWALLAPGRQLRKDALVDAARDSVKLIIGGCFLLIFAGLVEGFISHSLLPKPLKVSFGILSGFALYGYLFLSGRKEMSNRPVSQS
jgi:uncharacterized membrane protein SpoIIM required for sporulation